MAPLRLIQLSGSRQILPPLPIKWISIEWISIGKCGLAALSIPRREKATEIHPNSRIMGWISPHMARYLVCYYLGFRLLCVCVCVCVCVTQPRLPSGCFINLLFASHQIVCQVSTRGQWKRTSFFRPFISCWLVTLLIRWRSAPGSHFSSLFSLVSHWVWVWVFGTIFLLIAVVIFYCLLPSFSLNLGLWPPGGAGHAHRNIIKGAWISPPPFFSFWNFIIAIMFIRFFFLLRWAEGGGRREEEEEEGVEGVVPWYKLNAALPVAGRMGTPIASFATNFLYFFKYIISPRFRTSWSSSLFRRSWKLQLACIDLYREVFHWVDSMAANWKWRTPSLYECAYFSTPCRYFSE